MKAVNDHETDVVYLTQGKLLAQNSKVEKKIKEYIVKQRAQVPYHIAQFITEEQKKFKKTGELPLWEKIMKDS